VSAAVIDAGEQGESVWFGPFRLVPVERLLEREGIPVMVGSRALDILIFLVTHAGKVVSQRDLISHVWPRADGSGLRGHIMGLRKALGDGKDGARYVTSVAGRGYCFVAPIRRQRNQQPISALKAPSSDRAQQLPTPLMRMMGRDETVRTISTQLINQRFVTIVGPGGIGKTTVAISVGHTLVSAFDGAVTFVELESLRDPGLVATALASTLGLMVHTQDTLASLLAFLRDRRLLLVLDNCEHVIDAGATLAEQLFSQAPQVHILATSREALRVEGEKVHRLSPLECPAAYASLSATEVQAFPAVQLFMDRAAASGGSAELSEADAPIVAAICKKLDGIALAIELAAGLVGAFGISGTAELLDSKFRLLHQQGRRTAPPRQRTLNALLDWSYNLLPVCERRVLRRLGFFVGAFTLDAAQSVAAEEGARESEVIDAIHSLVAKSLISIATDEGQIFYRLLETTRAYVFEKLTDSGEMEMVGKRYGLHIVNAPGTNDAESLVTPRSEGFSMHAHRSG
jgi:predicted ATPase/DNA-binding winged helix-turn-helix (wHTH) protein